MPQHSVAKLRVKSGNSQDHVPINGPEGMDPTGRKSRSLSQWHSMSTRQSSVASWHSSLAFWPKLWHFCFGICFIFSSFSLYLVNSSWEVGDFHAKPWLIWFWKLIFQLKWSMDMLKGAPRKAGGNRPPGARLVPYLHTSGDFGDYHVAIEGLFARRLSSNFQRVHYDSHPRSKVLPLELSPYQILGLPWFLFGLTWFYLDFGHPRYNRTLQVQSVPFCLQFFLMNELLCRK